jgi:RecB family exonuclease
MTATLWNQMVEDTLASASPVEPPRVNGHPEPPVAIVETAPPVAGELWSPSQLGTFLDCPAKWYFKYQAGLPDPPSGSGHEGSAVHRAQEFFFTYKLTERKAPPVEEALGAYEAAWEAELDAVEFRDDEDPAAMRAEGRALAGLYLGEVGDKIEPAAVEQAVAGEIGGVAVRGFIDLIDVHGRVIELKTTSKSPSGVSDREKLQLTTYDQLSPLSRGQATVYSVVKNKTPKLVEHPWSVTPEAVRYAETMYQAAVQGVADGLFYPRRGSNRCSRKYCPFWRECEREFGGEVSS